MWGACHHIHFPHTSVGPCAPSGLVEDQVEGAAQEGGEQDQADVQVGVSQMIRDITLGSVEREFTGLLLYSNRLIKLFFIILLLRWTMASSVSRTDCR